MEFGWGNADKQLLGFLEGKTDHQMLAPTLEGSFTLPDGLQLSKFLEDEDDQVVDMQRLFTLRFIMVMTRIFFQIADILV